MTENKISLEEAMAMLEAVVARMENEKLPLEESLKLYEEGIRLASRCATELEAAKRKIQILQRNADGEIDVVDLPEEKLSEEGEAE